MSARASCAVLGALLVASGARADVEEGAIEEIVEEAAAEDAAPVAIEKPDAWAALGRDVRVRKVVVTGFDGKGALRLRQAVLDALSEHTEVEIVGSKDVEVSGKSRGLSPNDAGDRETLSEELGIYAWVLHQEGGAIVLVDAAGEELAELSAGNHGGSEADLRAKIWSTLGPHVSDEGLRSHLLERLRVSAAGKLKAVDEQYARQAELAQQRAERRAAHLAASQQRALALLQAQQAMVVEQQQLAVARVQREQQAAAQQAELARQAELAQQAQQAQQAELSRQAELARYSEAAREQQLAQQQQQAAMAKQAAPAPQPVSSQPSDGAYPAGDGAVWQPGRAQPVFAGQPAQAQPAYAEPQPAYAPAPPQPAPAPAYAEPAPASAMPVSPATQAWLERRRAQQQR
jgi:hypothetical protein